MSGLRDWLTLDEEAEKIRERVAGWEHHEPTELASPIEAEQEFVQLQLLFEQVRGSEEELRFNSR